ncbi:MAG: SDR family oxidoreductase [Xanthomonadales bacterium]|nr:SDR family oxidoreductase [Xanthomonadales bacterium]
MKRILLAGSTGYLGSHIALELQARSRDFRAIARNPDKLRRAGVVAGEVFRAELTEPDSLAGCCKDIDVVISAVGITRQKDGLTYMDVDYQANLNLLHQAQKSGVVRFVYVSVLNGEKLRDLKICDAKEKFGEELKRSGLDYCIIRPNGFFSDMAEILDMARKGRVYLFGDGQWRSNPIHGRDLARFCLDAIHNPEKELEVGGPETLTQKEIAATAFEVLGRRPKISYVPEWVRSATLKLVRTFTGSKVYGPIEFFMTVMAMDMLAPEYGEHTLRDFFYDSEERT